MCPRNQDCRPRTVAAIDVEFSAVFWIVTRQAFRIAIAPPTLFVGVSQTRGAILVATAGRGVCALATIRLPVLGGTIAVDIIGVSCQTGLLSKYSLLAPGAACLLCADIARGEFYAIVGLA